MRRALDEMLQPVDPDIQRVLGILAASRHPLSKRHLEQTLGKPIEFSALLETGLGVWDDTRFGFHTRNSLVAGALIDRLSTEELAEIHSTLCEVAEDLQSLELASTPVSAAYSDTDEPVVEYWCLTAALEDRPGEGTYRNTGSVTATDPSGTTVQDKDEWHAALTSDLDPGVEPDHAIEFLYSTFRSEEEAP